MSVVDEKLGELRRALTPRPFRAQLVDSLEYLVRIEMPRLDAFVFDTTQIDWTKLSYFPHQLKKMVKNKTHLDLLCSKMSSTSKDYTITSGDLIDTASGTTNSNRTLTSLVNDGNYAERDYFALTGLLVRFVYKLVRCKSKTHKTSEAAGFVGDDKVFEFVLVIISCLADLSFYEDLRAQVSNSFYVFLIDWF